MVVVVQEQESHTLSDRFEMRGKTVMVSRRGAPGALSYRRPG